MEVHETMARHAPVVEHAGNTVTVIAPTAEEAMALAGDAGPGFRTTSIGKVRRGGLAGFFATEMVRVVAVAPEDRTGPARPAAAGRQVAPVGPPSLQLATADDLIASLCGSDGPFAGRLAAGLQRSLHEPPPTAADPPDPTLPHTPDPPPHTPANFGADDFRRSGPAPGDLSDESPHRQKSAAAPATPETTPETTPHTPANFGADDFRRSGPAPGDLSDESPHRQKSPPAGGWSAAALEAVGLPASLVARVAGVRPHDEVTWNAALMLAVRDWCGAELPPGAVMAGPACGDLAAALHVPVIDADAVADREGPVAVPTASAAELAATVGGRPVHLVVGGRWRHLATVRPVLVSAATDDDLIDAVRAAVAWDEPHGWVTHDAAVVRIDPFVVAAHVRALLVADGPPRPAAAPVPRRSPAPRKSRAGGTARPSASSRSTGAVAGR
jgi:hypothetical protein